MINGLYTKLTAYCNPAPLLSGCKGIYITNFLQPPNKKESTISPPRTKTLNAKLIRTVLLVCTNNK